MGLWMSVSYLGLGHWRNWYSVSRLFWLVRGRPDPWIYRESGIELRQLSPSPILPRRAPSVCRCAWSDCPPTKNERWRNGVGAVGAVGAVRGRGGVDGGWLGIRCLLTYSAMSGRDRLMVAWGLRGGGLGCTPRVSNQLRANSVERG